MHGFIPPERYLPYKSWREVRALASRQDTVLVLPLGTLEQHGPHLPLATDAVISVGILGAALRRLPAEASVFALPVLHYGKSNEHEGFPGTATLSASTLLNALMEIGESVYAWGVRRLVFFNAHGGQPQVVEIAARDLRQRHSDYMLFPFFAWRTGEDLGEADLLSAKERADGMHAGDAETSIMLALLESQVHMEYAVAEYPPVTSGRLRPEGALSQAWLTQDLSRSGVIGDPTTASVEKGHLWLQRLGSTWAGVLDELSRLPLAGG